MVTWESVANENMQTMAGWSLLNEPGRVIRTWIIFIVWNFPPQPDSTSKSEYDMSSIDARGWVGRIELSSRGVIPTALLLGIPAA